MVNLSATSYWGAKDQVKANVSNKFIGLGNPQSSTNKYRLAFGQMSNSVIYNGNDIVMVSAEGNRNGRVNPPIEELKLAIQADVRFITDSTAHANHPYNIGERQVAELLHAYGYEIIEETTYQAVWGKST